jgi:hypothetical protein
MQLFSKTDIGLLAYNDGKWFGRLASFGLADRSWISQYEPHDFFHSGYHSHYADTEMSALASATGKLGYNANIAMMEIDFEKDKKSVNLEDKILYANRMKQFISHNSNWQNPNAFMEFR